VGSSNRKLEYLETYNVIFEGKFYGFFGKRSLPFIEHEIELSLNFIPKTYDGQLKILSGKEKTKFGVFNPDRLTTWMKKGNRL